MACGCEYKVRMAELEKVRELARKAAALTESDQVICKREDGTFCFVPEGERCGGIFVEYVLNV